MKSCIGIILDLSVETISQLPDLQLSSNSISIFDYIPFIKWIFNIIEDEYDIFIGSYCDNIVIDILSMIDFMPLDNFEPEDNITKYKRLFIYHLQEADALYISKTTEKQLSEYQCKNLYPIFQNNSELFYEIGLEEYKYCYRPYNDPYFYFQIHPQPNELKKKIEKIEEYGDNTQINFINMPDFNFENLISNQYETIIQKILYKHIEKYISDQKNNQFIAYSPKSIINIILNLYKKAPTNFATIIFNCIKNILSRNSPLIDVALELAYKTINAQRYFDKNLVIISNGFNQYQKDPCDIINLHKNEVTIIGFYISKKIIYRPKYNSKQLYFNCPTNIEKNAKKFFEMCSTVRINFSTIQLLENQGWKIPSSGFCKLFFYINDFNLINEFLSIAKDIIKNNDVLRNVIGTNIMQKYICNNINSFKATNQGQLGICWAHACATVIHMSIARIMGRELPDFFDIRKVLLEKFGQNGQNVKKVLDNILYTKYKLQYNIVNEEQARKAILYLRPCIATFHLSALQWYNFSSFFRHNRTGTLTEDIINAQKKVPPEEESGGHAVVLIDFGDGFLTFLNSWGENWGDNGKFRIKNSSVLGKINYYDIFWTENDLTNDEKEAWNNRTTVEMKNLIWNYITKYPKIKIKCPHCESISEPKNFHINGRNCICPICNSDFALTIEFFAKNVIDENK